MIFATAPPAELSKKEKSLIGCHGQPALSDHFLDVAHDAAPNVDLWNVTEDDGTCHVLVKHTVVVDSRYSYLNLISGTNGSDAVAHTKDKILWALKDNTTIIRFKARLLIPTITDTMGAFGIIKNSVPIPDPNDMEAANETSLIHYRAGVLKFFSDGIGGAMGTDITAHVPLNTWFDFESINTVASSVCEIDGVIRATHTTQKLLPNVASQLACCVRHNGANAEMNVLYAEVWTE